MIQYTVRRLAISLVFLALVATLVFVLIHALPGDPAIMMLGGSEGVNIEQSAIDAVRKQLGLDKPILVQYLVWMENVPKFNLGKSFFTHQPVMVSLAQRLPKSLELLISALGIAILVGVPFGTLAAVKHDTFIDTLITTVATAGIAVPVYVIGTLAVLFFSIRLRWFPPSGYVPIWQNLHAGLRCLVLPAFALSANSLATIARMTRSSVIDVLEMDFVRTARAKGLSENIVIFKHVLKNSLIPVVTVIGLLAGRALGSMVLIEFIFNWPGISTLLITAISRRDYPIVQGVVLLIAVTFLLINLLVDLTYAYLDPRIKYD